MAHSSSPGRATVASPAPQKPSACFHTVASGTLQPGLHHHTPLHPLPAGKSPAAGWPLSTGLVLLHEMNRCGVGVGETGCGERSRGSGWLGVPGDSRAQLSSQPAWLSTAGPQGLLDLVLSPCQAAAAPPAPQTPALALSLCVTRWDLSFTVTPSQCPSVPRVCGWGGFALARDGKIPQKPLAPASQTLQRDTGCWQPRSPVGSGEIKPDLTRGNKYKKVKEKIEKALGRGECTGMRLSYPKNKLKKSKALF